MEAIKIVFDVTDVMELIAHMTDGPEPDREAAERWMAEHYDAISTRLEVRFRDYIRENWK